MENQINKLLKDMNAENIDLNTLSDSMSNAFSISEDYSKFISTIRDYKIGKIKKFPFSALPQLVQDEFNSSYENEKVDNHMRAVYAKIYADEFIKNEIDSKTKGTTDIDTGERKPYIENIYDKKENMENYLEAGYDDSEDVYNSYIDATTFKSIEEYSKTKIKKFNKKVVNLNRMIRDFNHNYTKGKATGYMNLNISIIPCIIYKHVSNRYPDIEPKACDDYLIVYLDYILTNNITSTTLAGHIYLLDSLLVIYELDLIPEDNEIYIYRVDKLYNILSTISTLYK